MKRFLKMIPFIGVILLNVLSEASKHNLETVMPFLLVISGVLLLNLLIAVKFKYTTYFMYGITGVAVAGAISALVSPTVGEFYLHNIISGLYVGLFIVAFFPPLLKMNPFTFEYSVKGYSKAITKGSQFLKINLILNYMWVVIFAIALVLTKITYTEDKILQQVLATAVPLLVQLGIGLPLTIKLPAILMQKVKGEQLHFDTIEELFQSMPFGLNAKRAKGYDELIQFKLSGKEPTTGYLTIKNQKCTYTDGLASNPKTTVISDSELWLKISNNEVAGDIALMKNDYQVEGDASILLNLARLFSSTEELPAPTIPVETQEKEFEYKTFPPKSIKNVIVFDGGPRSDAFSKTTFMTKNFCKGVESAGASVEYIKLKDKDIHYCAGCYQCWTKTPGECIYKDDMGELRKKIREADLVIFSSPLYIFNVTGIMKNFLDRLLPNMKPYMLINNGQTQHPHRYDSDTDQGFIVFSAAGFPEVAHNFDGLKFSFRCFSSHMEKSSLMGEFFLPAAEVIVHPVYKKDKIGIAKLCFDAGSQVINEGKVDKTAMVSLATLSFSKETFQKQANQFWTNLDGKKAYLSSNIKL